MKKWSFVVLALLLLSPFVGILAEEGKGGGQAGKAGQDRPDGPGDAGSAVRAE